MRGTIYASTNKWHEIRERKRWLNISWNWISNHHHTPVLDQGGRHDEGPSVRDSPNCWCWLHVSATLRQFRHALYLKRYAAEQGTLCFCRSGWLPSGWEAPSPEILNEQKCFDFGVLIFASVAGFIDFFIIWICVANLPMETDFIRLESEVATDEGVFQRDKKDTERMWSRNGG